jgi:hypothetical protein
VRHDDREVWLREFRLSVGSDMPSDVVDELVARTKAKVAEIESGDDTPTVYQTCGSEYRYFYRQYL